MRRHICRSCTTILLVGLALALAAPALAKGGGPPRGYAVVTGPRLAHPMIVSAPWNRRDGGYYGGEAEVLINLATFSGAIPGDVRYPGNSPSAGTLGPRYRITYFRDNSSAVVHQDLYPFTTSGVPWAHINLDQGEEFKTVFGGRFWGGGPKGSWASPLVGDTSLIAFLQKYGLPVGPPPAVIPTPPNAFDLTGLWLMVGLALGVLLLLAIVGWRSHSTSAHATIR